MYLVIALAAPWFGARLRQLAGRLDLVDSGRPLT